MELIFYVFTILLTFAISLGVGASTFAVLNFFVALWDDNISRTERKMMEVVYTVLRVAMGLILVSALIQGAIIVSQVGLAAYLSAPSLLLWIIVGVLYINAILMTVHKIPMSIAAGLQAGSWYTLGFLNAFAAVGLLSYNFSTLLSAYLGLVLLAIVVVNVYFDAQQKHMQKKSNGSRKNTKK